MILGEEQKVPVIEVKVDDPAQTVERYKVTLIHCQKPSGVELCYRWVEGDIEKLLTIMVMSPTITVDDVKAVLTSWGL